MEEKAIDPISGKEFNYDELKEIVNNMKAEGFEKSSKRADKYFNEHPKEDIWFDIEYGYFWVRKEVYEALKQLYDVKE